MTEAEFLATWQAERHVYDAWGHFVRNEIQEALKAVDPSLDVASFFKIPPVPRVKSDDSLLGKAFHREKPYTDPYQNIEDKVGVRFVVLLTADILRIQAVIEASTSWGASLDKDFEADRDSRPLEFAYQSKHYVVKSLHDVEWSGITIPAGTPCEVQLRTLLQHAHSELTHDNIYKREAGSEVTRKVERTIAKSMALIEAVDDFFELAVNELEKATQIERSALRTLSALYYQHVGKTCNIDKSSAIVLNAFRDRLGTDFQTRLDKLFLTSPFIAAQIKKRFDTQYIFRQPWIILAYLMVSEAPNTTAEKWPLTPEEIRPVYTDLGKAMP